MSETTRIVANVRARESLGNRVAFMLGAQASQSITKRYEELTPQELYEHDEMRQKDADPLFNYGVGDMQGEAEWMAITKNNDKAQTLREGEQ